MIVKVVTVHPSLIIVTDDVRTYELPADAFPALPQVGQQWTIQLSHEPNEEEQRDSLNALLPRS